jgi:hypothetical protein
MLVSAFAKPVIAPKKLVTNTRTRTATDHDMLISGVPVSFSSDIKETLVEIKNRLSSHKIFSITFNYLGHVYHTKVLKVTYSANQPLYKVALSSSISNNTPICWLQHQPQGWTMPLGQELEERLKQAITLAIGCQEFYLNL